jgi:hypothetical protein
MVALKQPLARYRALKRAFKEFADGVEAANNADLWEAFPLSADGHSFDIMFAGQHLHCAFSPRLLQHTGGALQFFLCDKLDPAKQHLLGETNFGTDGCTPLRHFAESERADPGVINIRNDAGARELVARYVLLALEATQ